MPGLEVVQRQAPVVMLLLGWEHLAGQRHQPRKEIRRKSEQEGGIAWPLWDLCLACKLLGDTPVGKLPSDHVSWD